MNSKPKQPKNKAKRKKSFATFPGQTGKGDLSSRLNAPLNISKSNAYESEGPVYDYQGFDILPSTKGGLGSQKKAAEYIRSTLTPEEQKQHDAYFAALKAGVDPSQINTATSSGLKLTGSKTKYKNQLAYGDDLHAFSSDYFTTMGDIAGGLFGSGSFMGRSIGKQGAKQLAKQLPKKVGPKSQTVEAAKNLITKNIQRVNEIGNSTEIFNPTQYSPLYNTVKSQLGRLSETGIKTTGDKKLAKTLADIAAENPNLTSSTSRTPLAKIAETALRTAKYAKGSKGLAGPGKPQPSIFPSNAYTGDGIPVYTVPELTVVDSAPTDEYEIEKARRTLDLIYPEETKKYIKKEKTQKDYQEGIERSKKVPGALARTFAIGAGGGVAIANAPAAFTAASMAASGAGGNLNALMRDAFDDFTGHFPWYNPLREDRTAPYKLPELENLATYNYGVQQLEVPNVPRGNAGEIAGSIVSSTATGAKLGKFLGPQGALIGGAVGAVAGGLGQLFAGGKRKKERQLAEQRKEINRGVLEQQSAYGNIQDMQAELYAEDGLKVGLPQRLIEIEGGEMVLEEVELTPSEGKTKKMFRLKREFPKGRKHSEGGINYIAAQGDVIIPANMRDKVKQALDGRDNLLIEQYISKLPTDGEYAKKGYRMGAKKLYSKGGEVPKYPTGGLVDFMINEGLGSQNKLAAGFGEDPFSGTKTALDGIKPEGFNLGNAINLGGNLLAPILNATAKGPQLPQAPRLAAVPNIEVTDATPEMNAIAREMNFRTQQQANQLSTGQARQARFNLANRALSDTMRQNRLNQVMRQDQATNQERQMRFNRDNQQAALYDQRAMQQLAADREAQAVRRQGLGDIGKTFALDERDRRLRENQLRKEGTLQSIYDLYSRYGQFNPDSGEVSLTRFNSPNEY